MDYVYAILLLIGGLGAFLLGASMLSENLGKLANNKIKGIFNRSSNKKLVGVGVGVATTAVVQSSSLTTVMVVGLVNAGIMSLFQATTVIMGANIGTTITAQIAALSSVGDIIEYLAISLTGIGAFMIAFTKKDKVKTVGNALAGLGLIFIGLDLMKNSMKIFSEKQFIVDLFVSMDIPIVLLFLGIAITALVQSSSAVTAILISMATEGLIIGGGGNAMLFIILGSNIGTCATAIISTIGANRNAKRASLIHLLFNVFGSVLFFILLSLWSSFMEVTFEKWFAGSPATQIAMFHTAFNVTCTLIFLPFSEMFVKVVNKILPDKKDENKVETYLDKRFLSTPTIAIEALIKETVMMLDLSMESVKTAIGGFINKDETQAVKVDELNEQVSVISKGISDYLVETSTQHISLSSEKVISALHNNNGDIVRVSELADNITKYTRRSVRDELIFSDSVYVQLQEMYEKLYALAEKTKEVVETNNKKLLVAVDEIEDTIDDMRKNLIGAHIERMNAGVCKPASSSVFINLVSNLERIGDHLAYIAHSVENL